MRAVKRNRVGHRDFGPPNVPPRVAKIELKILRYERRLQHKPAQEIAFDGGRLSNAPTGTKFAFFSAIAGHLSLQESPWQTKKSALRLTGSFSSAPASYCRPGSKR